MEAIFNDLRNINAEKLQPEYKRMYQVLLNLIDYLDTVPQYPSKAQLKKIGENLSKELAVGIMKVMGLDDFFVEGFKKGMPGKLHVDEYGVDHDFLSEQDKMVVEKFSKSGCRVYFVSSSTLFQINDVYFDMLTYYYLPTNIMQFENPKGKFRINSQQIIAYFYKILTDACKGKILKHSVMSSNLMDFLKDSKR
ncbi:hypothetical protein [Thermicanus aegyptius]|uniref:hypothetical protein n=1 Tax=Thermicanus aegyptius TaxID=94009 RepID=UPI000421D1D3|nr:hypothetical protein [Thermicanus aegyptius]